MLLMTTLMTSYFLGGTLSSSFSSKLKGNLCLNYSTSVFSISLISPISSCMPLSTNSMNSSVTLSICCSTSFSLYDISSGQLSRSSKLSISSSSSSSSSSPCPSFSSECISSKSSEYLSSSVLAAFGSLGVVVVEVVLGRGDVYLPVDGIENSERFLYRSQNYSRLVDAKQCLLSLISYLTCMILRHPLLPHLLPRTSLRSPHSASSSLMTNVTCYPPTDPHSLLISPSLPSIFWLLFFSPAPYSF